MRRARNRPTLLATVIFNGLMKGPGGPRKHEDVSEFRDMDPAAGVMAAWTVPGDFRRRRTVRRTMPALAYQLDIMAAEYHRSQWKQNGLIQ